MSTVRRSTTGVSAPASRPSTPAPSSPAAAQESASTAWTAAASSRRAPSRDAAALAESARTAATRLAPTLGPVSAAPLLKALGDGTATLEVPLRAGDYAFKGAPFTVKPGTVAHIHVQVKDGELVPVGNGQQGTSVKLTPPLDLPLWVTGNGVELRGDEAQQRFTADLGGFFDVSFKATRLSDLLSGGGAKPAGSGELGELAGKLVDLGQVKVDANVTLKESRVDIGGAQVQVDGTTTFSVKGDGQKATVSGHVQLDGFGLDHGGVKLASSRGGSAELSTTLTRDASGYQVDSKLSHVNLLMDRLETARPSALDASRTDRLVLGRTEVTDGAMALSQRLSASGQPQGGAALSALSLTGRGTLTDASLTVKDAKDHATLSASGDFDGHLALGPGGLTVDAKLAGAHLEVADLQQRVQGNRVSVEHLSVDGEVTVKAGAGRLEVDGQARSLDLVVDDFRGGAGAVKADLGRTHVAGAAHVHVGASGVQVDGRLKAEATIDSASFAKGKQAASLGQSKVEGELTKLNLGRGAPTLKVENARASLGVQGAAMDVGQAQVRGGGRVEGRGSVQLDANGLSLSGPAQVSMALSEGRVHSSTVDLALAQGSTAEVKLKELHLGRTTSVKVGPGTRIDAVLAGGTLAVGGSDVTLARGSKAELTVKSADLVDGKVDLRGTVKLDAGVQADTSALRRAGLAVEPADVHGRVRVSVDDVHLADDRLTLQGANLSLDARLGRVTGVQAPGQPGVGTLAQPVSVLSVDAVQRTSAASLAGVTPPPPGTPVDALRLLREGKVQLSVPMTGAIQALGLDVVKFPPGARLDLALDVKDGKVVTDTSRASLQGGVKAVGVTVRGVHLDAQHHVVAELEVAGRVLNLPVPGVKVPTDMGALATLAGKSAGRSDAGKQGGLATVFDLSHAQLDVSNATFSRGSLPVPGGAVELADGARLSFHGTPLAGSLSGSVALEGVTLAREDLGLAGGAGRAELKVGWRREGDAVHVEGGLSNLSLDTRALARKAPNGDYVALGAGRLTGGAVSFDAQVAVDARGLPRADVPPRVQHAKLEVAAFSGELKGARQTALSGVTEVGAAHVEGAVGFDTTAGLSLKAKVDRLDAQVAGVTLKRGGRDVHVERARMTGRAGTVSLGGGRVALDAQQLAWDATLREVAVQAGRAQLAAGQVRVTGAGQLRYDSKGTLAVDGTLHVEGRGASVASSVRVDPRAGVEVR